MTQNLIYLETKEFWDKTVWETCGPIGYLEMSALAVDRDALRELEKLQIQQNYKTIYWTWDFTPTNPVVIYAERTS